MMRYGIFLAMFLFLAGCEGKGVGASLPLKYTDVEIYVNNHKFGDRNGCGGRFDSPVNSSREKNGGSMTCGHLGAVSHLTWNYLYTDGKGDRYYIERSFPYGEPECKTVRHEVLYKGKELQLIEDDFQKIVIGPAFIEVTSPR